MVDSPADSQASPPREARTLPTNIVPLAAAAILVFSAVIVTCLWLLGMVAGGSFGDLGISALLALGAALLWQVVEKQRSRAKDDIQPLAWVAFPFSILLFLGQAPFLVRAVYPPIQDFFLRDGQVQARYVERSTGLKLEISFPKPLKSARGDLRINSRDLTLACFKKETGLIQWPSEKTLSISVPAMLEHLGQEKIETLSLNLRALGTSGEGVELPGRLLYADGKRVSPQTLRPREP